MSRPGWCARLLRLAAAAGMSAEAFRAWEAEDDARMYCEWAGVGAQALRQGRDDTGRPISGGQRRLADRPEDGRCLACREEVPDGRLRFCSDKCAKRHDSAKRRAKRINNTSEVTA